MFFISKQANLCQNTTDPFKKGQLTTTTPALKKGKIRWASEDRKSCLPTSLRIYSTSFYENQRFDMLNTTATCYQGVYNPKTKCMSFGLNYITHYSHVELPLTLPIITAGPQTRLLCGWNMLFRKTKKCNPKKSLDMQTQKNFWLNPRMVCGNASCFCLKNLFRRPQKEMEMLPGVLENIHKCDMNLVALLAVIICHKPSPPFPAVAGGY